MSATLRDRPVRSGSASGGVPARRAVARWAWRLLRREWRQQILVVALLTLAVAAAAFSVSAATLSRTLSRATSTTREELRLSLQLLLRGGIRAMLGPRFGLARAAEALALVQSGAAAGRVLIAPGT